MMHKTGFITPLRFRRRRRWSFFGVGHECNEVLGFPASFVLEVLLAIVKISQSGITKSNRQMRVTGLGQYHRILHVFRLAPAVWK